MDFMQLSRLAVIFFLFSLLAPIRAGEALADHRDDPLLGFHIMSEEFPPYNYTENGRLKGIAADLLREMLPLAGSSRTLDEVKVLPWSRSYDALLKSPNTMLFSVTRTKEREKLFKWVGPIAPNRNVLIGHRHISPTIRSLQDLTSQRIGAIPHDAGAQLLLDAGVSPTSFDYATTAKLNLLKLAEGRIDMFAYAETVAYWTILQNDLQPQDFMTLFVVNDGEVYFALHRSTPDAVVERLQAALDILREGGQAQAIIKQYAPSAVAAPGN